MSANKTPFAALALSFAEALMAGDFAKAHSMLGSGLGHSISSDSLRQTYEGMIDYGDGPVITTELTEALEDWPEKQANDLGWAYVAMSGDNYSEAVCVVVALEDGAPTIREIQWGRP